MIKNIYFAKLLSQYYYLNISGKRQTATSKWLWPKVFKVFYNNPNFYHFHINRRHTLLRGVVFHEKCFFQEVVELIDGNYLTNI